MEVKDGNELKQAIHDINVQEELAEIAYRAETSLRKSEK